MTVRESAKLIASLAQNVHVDYQACERIAQQIRAKMIERNYGTVTWSTHPLNPGSNMPGVVDWIFTVDTLNFSFWAENPQHRFEVDYQGQKWTGYWSMVAAINRALEEKIPITTPTFWCTPEFTPQLLAHVFRSANDVPAPLMEERYAVLKEAGSVLKNEGASSFSAIVERCDHSAVKLVNWIVSHLHSYNDQFAYKGHQVQIFKRAQILVADLWACFGGQSIGQFKDVNEITMFADYRVPQILHVLGAIKYSPELARKLEQKEYLPSGCEDEVEIRGCSIHSVEVIVSEINKLEREAAKKGEKSHSINAILVDFYLWDTAKEEEEENTRKVECHRTRSVFY